MRNAPKPRRVPGAWDHEVEIRNEPLATDIAFLLLHASDAERLVDAGPGQAKRPCGPVEWQRYSCAMDSSVALERKVFFVDPTALKSARRILRARSDGEAVRMAIARVEEIEESWSPLLKMGGTAPCDCFEGA